MRALTSCVVAAVAMGFATASVACEQPTAVAVPDGKTSTREEMLAGQAQIRAYQTAMDQFLACIDGELTAEGEQAPEEFKALMVSRHNAAVAEMEGVAAAFNEQLRAFRAANPTPPATN
ncbi:MAG TPA: hypothetical protein VKA43_07885 [Gammaproteobacteria bacterium]|nr:hypothetical protein [Gammaproteobacteria bacterium]